MKKIIIIAAMALIATGATAQKTKFNYRVGVVTSLPTGVENQGGRVYAGSTLLEFNKKISKKISLVANAGFLRINSLATLHNVRPLFVVDTFVINGRVPLLAGARYHMDDKWYFGASLGYSILTNPEYDGETHFTYTPYIGYQVKKISVDMRYYVSGLKTENNYKTMMLVFSYTL